MHLLCFDSLFKEWLWQHFIDESIHFRSNRKNLDTCSGPHGPWWGDNRSSSCGFSDLVACSGKRGTGLATNLQCCCCCREDRRCQWRHWALLDWQELKPGPDSWGNQVQKCLAQPAVQGVLFQWLCRIWPNMGEVRKRRRKQPLMISLSLGLSADGFTARPFTVQELPEFWDFPSSWLIVDRSTSFELGKSLNLRSFWSPGRP